MTCGFYLPLAGLLGQALGACGNEFSPADGRVVDAGFGCGAHSDTVIDAPLISASTETVIDELTLEVHDRPAPVGAEWDSQVQDAATEDGMVEELTDSRDRATVTEVLDADLIVADALESDVPAKADDGIGAELVVVDPRPDDADRAPAAVSDIDDVIVAAADADAFAAAVEQITAADADLVAAANEVIVVDGDGDATVVAVADEVIVVDSDGDATVVEGPVIVGVGPEHPNDSAQPGEAVQPDNSAN